MVGPGHDMLGLPLDAIGLQQRRDSLEKGIVGIEFVPVGVPVGRKIAEKSGAIGRSLEV